jgi:cyclophilin family peptidyl-prolyl cis-trans isomerase
MKFWIPTILLSFMFTNPAVSACKDPEVIIRTPYGKMILQVYKKDTPLHAKQFLKLVRKKYYDQVLFHRVIENFMIQGGDPDSKGAAPNVLLGSGGPKERIPAEFRSHLFHKKGVLAAARDNNPEKASSGSQFYIVQGRKYTAEQLDSIEIKRLAGRKLPEAHRKVYMEVGGTPHLDQNYTIFGQLKSGWSVLDSIAAQKTDGNNRPLADIPMTIRKKKRFLLF